tara:strand:- start:86 stop:802 length:717 start_codon:yes stop_codon:yes gene_type:complete
MDALICVRMGSSRLPGKALMEIGDNMNSLDLIVKKIKNCTKIDRIIIATTKSPKDDAIVEWATDKNVIIYRGSENDVLGRINNAVNKFECEHVMEILGDNPLVPEELISECVYEYESRKKSEIMYLASATNEYKFSNPSYVHPIGIRVQIFSKSFINKIESLTWSNSEREHSTSFIYDKPDFYGVSLLEPKLSFPKIAREFNFAINTKEQLENAKSIFKIYGKNHTLSDLINWVGDND